LPDLTWAAFTRQLDDYFGAFYGQHENSEKWFATLDRILGWLWDVLMSRTVSALSADTEAVLIPGGWLHLLPLHAARTADPVRPGGWRYALDSVRFRYAASARALLPNTGPSSGPTPDSLLAIDQPLPVSGPGLPNSQSEILAAGSHFKGRQIIRHREATKAAVLAALPAFEVLHFACHGRPDFDDPLAQVRHG
jgi:CHAT domain-containing protein